MSVGNRTVTNGRRDRVTIFVAWMIDNADILLDDNIRKYISVDGKNQYLIIGRNPKNLFTTSDNLFELVSEKVGEQTEFKLEKYL